MINSLYQFTTKGSFRALSFILALASFASVLLKSGDFLPIFGAYVPLFVMLLFYSMAILWIHAIGFVMEARVLQAVLLPLLGYVINLCALALLWLNAL